MADTGKQRRTFVARAEGLAAECGYDEYEDGSVDVLIEYKNALEDAHLSLCGVLDRLLAANARGESHASAADVMGELFGMQEQDGFGAVDDRLPRLRELARDASAARDADEDRWEQAGVGQDTEEAEESGRLIGRADALAEAVSLLDGS